MWVAIVSLCCHPELTLASSRCPSSLRRQNLSVPEKRQRYQFAELYCFGVLIHSFYCKIEYQVRCAWAVKRNFTVASNELFFPVVSTGCLPYYYLPPGGMTYVLRLIQISRKTSWASTTSCSVHRGCSRGALLALQMWLIVTLLHYKNSAGSGPKSVAHSEIFNVEAILRSDY
jgi:hypothetical protein